MEISINTKVKVKITQLQVDAGVRYWEDATVNDVEDTEGDLIPCRADDRWCPLIDIETGKILNWEIGTKAEIHYKVCDDGSYYLLDETGKRVLAIEDNYVPDCMSPKENGFGDYIIMDVNEDGIIADWEADFEDFTNNDED